MLPKIFRGEKPLKYSTEAIAIALFAKTTLDTGIAGVVGTLALTYCKALEFKNNQLDTLRNCLGWENIKATLSYGDATWRLALAGMHFIEKQPDIDTDRVKQMILDNWGVNTTYTIGMLAAIGERASTTMFTNLMFAASRSNFRP